MTADQMMFGSAMAAVLGTMALALVRSIRGPDVFDRILAANSFGSAADTIHKSGEDLVKSRMYSKLTSSSAMS